MKNGHINKTALIVKLVCILAVMLTLSLLGYTLIKNLLLDSENLREYLEEHKALGVIVVFFISALQVVIALIPGEIVEIAAGYILGAWQGSLVCLAGATLGSVAVIMIVRRIGKSFVISSFSRERIDSLRFLSDKTERNLFTVLLFFIPGTPKDLLTYVIGLTDMSVLHYVLFTSLARYPSIISSCMGGDALGSLEIVKAVWILSVTAAVSIIGMLVYRSIVSAKNKREK